MKNCKHCNSKRIASVSAKCSDLCFFETTGFESDGYVPSNFGIGGGDYVEFDYCLECGQIQGEFPIILKPVKYCPDCNNKIKNYDDDYWECSACDASSYDIRDDEDDEVAVLMDEPAPSEPIEFEEW